jgi:hypothetical protein
MTPLARSVEHHSAEWAAWNLGIEAARQQYDRKNGGWWTAESWALSDVRNIYDTAWRMRLRELNGATMKGTKEQWPGSAVNTPGPAPTRSDRAGATTA